MGHDPREIFWQRAEVCEREAAESGTGGEDSEEIGEVRELVASEVGKDLLTWATTLKNWEDGSRNVVCTLFVRDLHTIGVDQQILPVGIN